MQFKQYKDGSCDIEFSKEEIDLLSKKGSLHLSSEDLRHFGNNLMKMVLQWNTLFNEEIKKLQTFEDTKIKGK